MEPISYATPTQRVDYCFVMTDHRSKRTRNQMQLVLYDEFWWRVAGGDTEQSSCRRFERQHRELVHGANDQGWGRLVNVLIDYRNRETLIIAEIAVRVVTDVPDAVWPWQLTVPLALRGAPEALQTHAGAAPGTA